MEISNSGSGETATGSGEVSVPTDLTITTEGDGEETRHICKREMYNSTTIKGLQQSIATLQLQLQEKNAQLVSSKAQYTSHLDQKNLEHKLKLSEKQAKINRLEAEVLATNDELKLLKDRALMELANLLQKCREFQRNQARLMVKHDEIKSSLANLIISEEEINQIRNLPQDQLNLLQFLSLRVHGMVLPLNLKIKELEGTKTSLERNLSMCEQDLANKCKQNEKLIQETKTLREKLTNVTRDVEDLKKEMKSEDFKVRNFDRIKRERDNYEDENEQLLKEKNECELSLSVCSSEKKVLEERMGELKEKLKVQEQELGRFKSDFLEAESQLEKRKENSKKTSSQLKLEQERSETIHEKFLKAKMEIINLTETLHDAKNEIKSLTEKNQKISQLEKEKKEKLNDLQKRYAEVSDELEYLQRKFVKEKDECKLEISELKSRYYSLSKTYSDVLENNSRLVNENQTNQISFQNQKVTKEEEILKMKQEIKNLRSQLDQYKALENEYLSTLNVIASEVPENQEFSEHLCPASTIVKGKLSEETISLTRRILNLEKNNMEACRTIQKFTSTLDQMRHSLASYKVALASVGRPSEQLLEKIRSQEEQILVLEEALQTSNDVRNKHLSEIKQYESDLLEAKKHLKNNQINTEELLALKKEISKLKGWTRQNGNKRTIPDAIKITKS